MDNYENWCSGIIEKNGTFYLPPVFTEFFLKGKKQGYVKVTRDLDWYTPPNTERVRIRCILIMSIQDFKKLQNKIETNVSLSDAEKRSIGRYIIAPSSRCLLRDDGKMTISSALRHFTYTLGHVLVTKKNNRVIIIPVGANMLQSIDELKAVLARSVSQSSGQD